MNHLLNSKMKCYEHHTYLLYWYLLHLINMHEWMRINFRIIDSTYAILNISKNDNSIILGYPCGEILDTCSAYYALLPQGSYIFEGWGAQGGFDGGKGGYSTGVLKINKKVPIYVYVGAHGSKIEKTAGLTWTVFNGGGEGYSAHSSGTPRSTGSGGGGTDVRLIGNSYDHRLIVAGGGGGRSNSYDGYYDGTPGCGGGLIGGNSQYGKGGLQDKAPSVSGEMESGKFGEGGSAPQGTSGGGGGGWFGGSTGKGSTASGGAGGSGYVLNISSHKPSAYKLNDPQYFLMSSKTFDGKSYFPKCEGSIKTDSIENGHSGHGCVRITILSQTAFCTIKKINPLFNQFVKISSYLLIINMNSS